MKRAGFFITIGIAAYLLIVVFTLPAVQVEGYIEKQVPGLLLYAVSGSVFNGRAERVSYQGISLGSAHWRYLPSRLLTGRVEYHLEFSAPNGPGRANAGMTFAGNAYGRNVDLNFLADDIINQYSPVAVRASGEINLQVETLEMGDGFPHDLGGKVLWKSAAILSPLEMVLGDTLMNLQIIGGELVGSIENEGDFEIGGDIAIKPGGKYRVDLLLFPKASVNRDALQLLESTTTLQADGRYLLHTAGQW